jgi:hypothetical protein
MSDNIKQLKLVTGEEIICEIIEEDDQDLIIRNPLAFEYKQEPDGTRLWSYRLFMCYQDDPDKLILVKIDKIVAIANPVPSIVKQYIKGVESIMDYEGDDYDEEDDDIEYDSNVLPFPTVH